MIPASRIAEDSRLLNSRNHRPNRVLLWLAGSYWDGAIGTDRRLVEELAKNVPVLWCDPPLAAWRYTAAERSRCMEEVAPNVIRLRVPSPPGSAKFGVRRTTTGLTNLTIRRALDMLDAEVEVQVVASPRQLFVNGISGKKFLYLTDHWIDGAALMGLSARWIGRNIDLNANAADVIAGVSGYLLDSLAIGSGTAARAKIHVLANGCLIRELPAHRPSRDPVSGLVGQINERLDLATLEHMVDSGLSLRFVGHRADKDRFFSRRLDRLLTSSAVEYVGPVPASEVPLQLSRFGVGITPYTLSEFNKSSFPLKTLEYLAAGIAVVSTDLPAVGWLRTDLVKVATDPAGFSLAAAAAINDRMSADAEAQRIQFANQHSWASRSSEFLALCNLAGSGRTEE